LCYPDRRRSGFGPPGIHGAVRHPQSRQGLAELGVSRRDTFCFLPEPPGLVLAAETAIQESQIVPGRDILGITGQGFPEACLRLLPTALYIIRETEIIGHGGMGPAPGDPVLVKLAGGLEFSQLFIILGQEIDDLKIVRILLMG
jgi:hypothetical protein